MASGEAENNIEAIRIISTPAEENNLITLDETALRNILMQEEIKNKKVCVISITGTFRQGKSFLLNFFLRYLKLKYGSSPIPITSDRSDESQLTGFSWQHGSRAHTSGILMWPEIFTVQKPQSHEEIAVILIDTQGAFDNETTTQNSAEIFAISTLISSVQIFNVMRNLDQQHLENLEMFGHYGKRLAKDEQDSPFQELYIVIRDWLAPYERPFGVQGGESLLEENLTVRNDIPNELNEQRENIRKLFNKINCCLLPFPGQAVAYDQNFTGNLNDIDHTFKQHVRQLVEEILAPENLVVKQINGEEITAEKLFESFQRYTDIFRNGLNQFESSLQLRIRNEHNNAVDNCFNIYKNQIRYNFSSEFQFEEHHESCKTLALDEYQNICRGLLGYDDSHREGEKRLLMKVNDHFEICREQFRFKLQVTIMTEHNNAVEQSLDLYRNQMQRSFSSEALFRSHHESCRTSALNRYRNLCREMLSNDDVHNEEYEQQLLTKINDQFEMHRERLNIEREREQLRRRMEQLQNAQSVVASRPSSNYAVTRHIATNRTSDIFPNSLEVIGGVLAIGLGIFGIVEAVRNNSSTSRRNNSNSSDEE